MVYSLSPDEIEKVRDLVRMIVDRADYNRETIDLTPEAERLIAELAYDIQRFIQ